MKEYLKDGRKPVSEIYNSYSKLTNFNKNLVYSQKVGKHSFPIFAFSSKKRGNAVWLISGIHGEEPAGVNAISENIEFINKLSKKMPLVLLPLCNPKGYFLNQRYPEKGKSVTSSEHFLLTKKQEARVKNPESKTAYFITKKVLDLVKAYPPELVLDFHEDRGYTNPYIYSQGILGYKDPIAKLIIKILIQNKMGLQMKGKTSLKEKIINGIVSNIRDGSIDELLTSTKIIVNGKIKPGPKAKSAVVIETRTIGVPLSKRIEAHSEIIRTIPKFVSILYHSNYY